MNNTSSKHPEHVHNLRVRLPTGLRRRAQHVAIERGVSLAAFMREAIREVVERAETQREPIT